jgi:hypothetical protein
MKGQYSPAAPLRFLRWTRGSSLCASSSNRSYAGMKLETTKLEAAEGPVPLAEQSGVATRHFARLEIPRAVTHVRLD